MARSDSTKMRRICGRGAAAALRAAGLAGLLAAASSPAPAQAQEETPFESLPTSDLVELYALISGVLSERGVLPAAFSPTDAYASWLVRETLDLSDAASPTDLMAQSGDGRRYLIAAARAGEGARLAVAPPPENVADVFVVVVFTADHRVRRAASAPAADVRAIAENGRVALDRAAPFWDIGTLRDLTPQVFRVATNYDLTSQ